MAVEARTGVFTDGRLLPAVTGIARAAAAAGAITAEQERAWIAGQEERAAKDRMLLAIPFFVASAARPAR
uniref:hypothetical protein n=1 Tax=Nonomuraea pusilla TaxID=46177 RepID=UPI0006E35599|nr:hypothetical protein [Nonomuraea pusilla]